MEIEAYLQELKDLQGSVLSFIESEDNCDKQFLDLCRVLEDQQITNDKTKSKSLHNIILKIANNHQRTSDFFDKIGRIFHYVFNQSQLSNSELTEIYSSNKRIIFLLLEKGYLQPGTKLLSDLEKRFDHEEHQLYFYPAIKSYFSDHIQMSIETHIMEKYGYDINTFTEKCRIGENDTDICCLIRQDTIDEFVSYLHRTNVDFSCHIGPSLFETNPFLIQNDETCQLIDYATFFGSIQIIKYLLNNGVEPKSEIWLYAIHSNNAELIQMIEDSRIQPPDDKYESCLKESIKCYHNDISIYIEDNFMKQYDINYSAGDQLAYEIVKNYNYVFIPDIVTIISNPKKTNWFSLRYICFDFKKLTIPKSVKSIADYSFSKCNLVEIIIPDSVTSIGSFVFYGTPTLKRITIPKSVVSFGEQIFDPSMTSLEILGDLETIPNNFFNDCESLKKLTYPLSVKKIGDYAFNGCFWLKEFVIESSIKEIGEGAFFQALNMSEIVIPESVSVIRSMAFSNCSNLKKVTILAQIKTIERYTFLECMNLEKIEIPSSVTVIEYGAFTGCVNLDHVVIPQSVTTISENAFYSCTKLAHIEIPSSVKSIGKNAFKKCPVVLNTSPKHVIDHDLIPYITCFVLPSIDGKLKYGRFSNSFYSCDGNILDICNEIGKNELNSNVVLIGRTTFYKDFCSNSFRSGYKTIFETKFAPYVAVIDKEKGFLIVADTKGMSIYEGEKVLKNNCIAILSDSVSADYLKYLRENNISYVFSGKDGNDMIKAMSDLKKLFGFQRILLEGGGVLNASFLKLGLIDEIALLVMPFIEGISGQPSIFECNGNDNDFHADDLKLELLNVSALKSGIVFTRYKVHYQ